MSRDTDTDAGSAVRNRLSEDIRYLGTLLGNVIRLQHGEEALQLVEDIRAQARQRREHAQQPGASSALAGRIASLDLEAKRILIKAFANYFQLINRELSRAPESSEQFVWLNRRYGETGTQLSRSAIMPSIRADSSQNEVI